jgi:flavin reductase (DIM6/NTAB) family NADH-FMN oxidoreductase RutF
MPIDSTETIFRATDRELWIVTAGDGARRGGLVATTVVHASIVPELPRVLVTIGCRHHTWECIEASGAFALHLLDETQLDWVWRFGLESGRDIDKFRDLQLSSGDSGSPILTDAVAWLDCRIENRMPTGDRTVYLAEVIDADCRLTKPPLTIQRMLALAPPDKLQQLKVQRIADAARDADAIRNWREA